MWIKILIVAIVVHLFLKSLTEFKKEELTMQSFKVYRELLNKGCPRELARSVLPMGTYTHMFATMNLHNLFNFLRERLHPHAQYEIRVYAQAMLDLIQDVCPVAVKAFTDSIES